MDVFGTDDAWAQVSKVEVSLMNKRRVNVFNCPPPSSAMGHNTEDWRGKQIWTGMC